MSTAAYAELTQRAAGAADSGEQGSEDRCGSDRSVAAHVGATGGMASSPDGAGRGKAMRGKKRRAAPLMKSIADCVALDAAEAPAAVKGGGSKRRKEDAASATPQQVGGHKTASGGMRVKASPVAAA